MRSMLVVLGIVTGCGHRSLSPPPAKEATTADAPLLAAVGPHPRGYAKLSLADPEIRAQLTLFSANASQVFDKSPGDCNIDLARLERVRVAIGEPLRIAAELDGKIDVHAVSCLLREATMTALARGGLVLRDRPGGIAIEYRAEPTQAGLGRAAGAELASRCAGASCVAVVLGPASRPLWLELQLDSATRIQLSGPSLGHGAAAAVAAIDLLRATTPEMKLLVVREQQGALVIELPKDPPTASMIAIALALRTHVLESFKVSSSSMVPTLLIGDKFFVAKGTLLGEPVLGDLLVYNQVLDQEPRSWVKRYLAGPGQTVAETAAGISIDGTPLATEVVDANFHYHDYDETTGQALDRSGTVVREHLGARSYLTLRTGPPNRTGSWTAPAGHVFLIGDSRNNSNDSRYLGTTPRDAIIGRVLGIWFALRDGAPDWDRMGVPLE